MEGILQRATPTIDLRPSVVDVGPESIQRATNYEYGNVFAIEYRRDDLPDDLQLQTDLLEFIPLLEEIYRNPVQPDVIELPKAVVKAGSRRMSDARLRTACEYRAMDVVEAHYRAQGWEVEDVHRQYLGYDLRCIRDEEELHVEVKGSIVRAQQVELTANEVTHAREYASPVLAVVDQIEILFEDDQPVGTSGTLSLQDPWEIDENKLAVTRYVFRL